MKARRLLDDATDGDAAEADPVIATLSPDEPGARSLSDGALVCERYLQGRFDQFGARAREDAIEARGRDLGEPFRELECNRMAHLEGRREIEGVQLSLDRLGDFATGMRALTHQSPTCRLLRICRHQIYNTSPRPALNCRLAVKGIQKFSRLTPFERAGGATFNVIAHSQDSSNVTVDKLTARPWPSRENRPHSIGFDRPQQTWVCG